MAGAERKKIDSEFDSDNEFEDWNVVSDKDIDRKISDNLQVENKVPEVILDDEDNSSSVDHHKNGCGYISYLIQMFKNYSLTNEDTHILSLIGKSVLSIIGIILSYFAIRNAYYLYKTYYMIGLYEEVPQYYPYIGIQFNQCDREFKKYQDILNNCIASDKDNQDCASVFKELLDKNKAFCNWDVDSIYQSKKSHIYLMSLKQRWYNFADSSANAVTYLNEEMIITGSKNAYSKSKDMIITKFYPLVRKSGDVIKVGINKSAEVSKVAGRATILELGKFLKFIENESEKLEIVDKSAEIFNLVVDGLVSSGRFIRSIGIVSGDAIYNIVNRGINDIATMWR